MALLVVAGWGALGVGVLLAGPVAAAPASAPPAAASASPTCTVLGLPVGVCPVPAGGAASLAKTWGPAPIQTMWSGVAQGGHVDTVTLTVSWTTTGTPAAAPVPDSATATFTATCTTRPDAGGSQECDVAWPSGVEANGYVLNGQYSVSATAVTCPDNSAGGLVSCSSSSAPTPVAEVTVTNPPAPPANVTAALAKAPASGVTVTWAPSPEPDVFGYAVYRVSGSQSTIGYGCAQAFAPAEVRPLPRCDAKPSWTDTASGGGKFSYQVFANRFGGASYLLKDQVRSQAGLSKGSVTVPGPPAASALVPARTNGLAGLGGFFSPVKVRGGNAFSAPNLGPPATPGTVDPGFAATLPYGQPAPTDPPAVVSAPPAPSAKARSSVGSIALVGTALLVIVVALHGLWLRGEVRRSGALEVLEPEM